MKAINTRYYGDQTRWFIGIVESINDPLRLGRVRVRIYGVHSEQLADIPTEHLPWASVVLPVTQGGVGGSTGPTGIQAGAQVFGFFADGETSQLPIVLGSIPHDRGQAVSFSGPYDLLYTPVTPISADINPGGTVSSNGNPSTQVAGRHLPLVGGSNEEIAYNWLKAYFIQRGSNYPSQQAAGFVGNFINEAGPGIPPNAGPAYDGVSGTVSRWGQESSFGIAQWNSSAGRFPNLVSFASPRDWRALDVQLQFVAWELENTHTSVLTRVLQSSTTAAATEVVMRYYEVPAVAVDYNLIQQNRPVRFSDSASNALNAYRLELNERIADARAVEQAFGG